MNQLSRSIFGKGLFAFALLTMVSCGGGGAGAGNNGGGGNNEYPSVEQMMGPSGGQLDLPGYATLNVPAGALPGNTRVRIETSNADPNPGNDDSVLNFQIEGSSTSRYMVAVDINQILIKNNDITLTFSLPAEWVNKGIKASAVRVYQDQLYISETEALTDFVSMDAVTKIISDKSLSITITADSFESVGDIKEHTKANFILVASPEDQRQSSFSYSNYTIVSQAVISNTISPFLWAPYNVNSSFGARFHPIKKVWEGHKGMDIIRVNRMDEYKTSKMIYPVADGEIWKAHGANYNSVNGKLTGYG